MTMRTYDIPYTKSPSYNGPTKSADELTDIREITKKYLCGKAMGRVSECLKCESQCAYGKRAIALLYPPPIAKVPLQIEPGKTMVEMAKAESARLRAEAEAKEKKKEEEKPKKKGRGKTIDDWYDKAYESGDPLKWIMEHFELNERKAKQKVYAYQYLHPELKETKPMWKKKEPKETKAKDNKVKEAKPVEEPVKAPESVKQVEEESVKKPVRKQEKSKQSDIAFEPFEDKLDKLMKLQEEYKQKAEHYQKLYQETKAKVDTVFAALNILDE